MSSRTKRAVFFFCAELGRDPVAARVLEATRSLTSLEEMPFEVDGAAVLRGYDRGGNEMVYVRTADVVNENYTRYLRLLNDRFRDYSLACVVNWHEGGNAPDRIFMVHTSGDVTAGVFGAADPRLTTDLILSIERARIDLGLLTYRTVTEATHWSGVRAGESVDFIGNYSVPVVDVEIGSSPAAYADPAAAAVLARGLLELFLRPRPSVVSTLCVGGIHFEPAFATPLLEGNCHNLALSHILANRWLIEGEYDGPEGAGKLERCVASVVGGVDLFVFHHGIKSGLRGALQTAAALRGVSCVSHRRLRQETPILAD